MADPKPYRLGTFAGVNTRQRRQDLKAPNRDDPRAELHDARNVDLSDVGTIASRPGFESLRTGNVTALWSDDDVCYVVLDGTLYEIDAGLGLASRYVPGEVPVRFCRENGIVYFATPDFTGQIDGLTVSALGIPQPTATLAISALSAGSLYAGQYGVGISLLDAAGNESGMGEPAWFDLATAGGIQIAGIPSQALRINVYATQHNGTTFWRVATLPAGTTSYSLLSVRAAIEAQNVGVWPAPVGLNDIAIYKGRMYGAVANTLAYSEPLTYGWWKPENYIAFPSYVLHTLPVDGGLYVVLADQILFLAGTGPGDFSQVFIGKYAPVQGTPADVRNVQIEGAPRWLITTDKGVLALGEGGAVANLTTKRLQDFPKSPTGGGVLRDYLGQRHYIATMQGDTDSRVGLQDSMTLDVFYNGLPVREQE